MNRSSVQPYSTVSSHPTTDFSLSCKTKKTTPLRWNVASSLVCRNTDSYQFFVFCIGDDYVFYSGTGFCCSVEFIFLLFRCFSHFWCAVCVCVWAWVYSWDDDIKARSYPYYIVLSSEENLPYLNELSYSTDELMCDKIECYENLFNFQCSSFKKIFSSSAFFRTTATTTKKQQTFIKTGNESQRNAKHKLTISNMKWNEKNIYMKSPFDKSTW